MTGKTEVVVPLVALMAMLKSASANDTPESESLTRRNATTNSRMSLGNWSAGSDG